MATQSLLKMDIVFVPRLLYIGEISCNIDAYPPSGTYFFTVVTFAQQKILCGPENIELLKTAIRLTQAQGPFVIDAFVLLPDHLHTI